MHEQLAAATRFDPRAHIPLVMAGRRVGWVGGAFASTLRDYPDAFACTGEVVDIRSPARVADAVRHMATTGLIRGWRDELYEVKAHGGGATLFTLERAAFRRFGMRARAAHLNGWVYDAAGCRLWIARRSEAKPIDPGALDNLVGGGIAAGATPESTLVKECAEEAGIAPALAGTAQRAGTLHILRALDEGVHDETIHVFDLEVPQEFVPRNLDGEVSEFMLLSPGEVELRVGAGEFTVDAAAVTVDFLWRKGLVRDAAIGSALAALREPRIP